LPFYIKKYLKAKEELWKLKKYFTTQKYNLQKILQKKKNQNSSRYYYNSMTESQFQHKPKISSFKNPHIKIDLLPRGQNPISYYTL
jgi:hypothetical protein